MGKLFFGGEAPLPLARPLSQPVMSNNLRSCPRWSSNEKTDPVQSRVQKLTNTSIGVQFHDIFEILLFVPNRELKTLFLCPFYLTPMKHVTRAHP